MDIKESLNMSYKVNIMCELMTQWWKSLRGLVNESQLWQKRATGSKCNSNIQECYRVCFQSASNSSGEEASSGTHIKKKKKRLCPGWWAIFSQPAEVRKMVGSYWIPPLLSSSRLEKEAFQGWWCRTCWFFRLFGWRRKGTRDELK